jgi:GAF domain-containing protein
MGDSSRAPGRRQYMNPSPLPQRSKDPFAGLSQIVLGEQSLPEILEQVVHLAKAVLPAVQASVTLIAGEEPHTPAYTGEPALALDERQYKDGGGPCVDAANSGQTVLVTDTRTDTRWPVYSEAAAASGILSSLSIPLPVQRLGAGALNFYAAARDAFDDEAIDLARTFAGHAAVAVGNAHLYESTARLAEQMQQAMASRAIIEQAKGIIMGNQGCSAEHAFNTLVRLSQTSHVRLRDVALRLVENTSSGADNHKTDA